VKDRRAWAIVLFAGLWALPPAVGAEKAEKAAPWMTLASLVHRDVSPPLHELRGRGALHYLSPLSEPEWERRHPPPARLVGRTPVSNPDPLVSRSRRPTTPAAPTPSPTESFEGLSDDDNDSEGVGRVVPSDAEGDVGPDHYVQSINSLFAVFDKDGDICSSAGCIVTDGGPFANSDLWAGFGGLCETHNDGDPIVVYDHLADRWVFSQFALVGVGSSITDSHQCFAVSTSSDPTGSYYRYDFQITPGEYNDFPKLGVWPDGYYMSFNQFDGSTGDYNGAVVAAFERDEMLDGNVALAIFTSPPLACDEPPGECFFSLEPGHLEGPPPPEDTPNPFIMAFDEEVWGGGSGADGYRIWEFAVDWDTPLDSTLTPLPQIDVPAFDSELCSFDPCVPQMTPGEDLETSSQYTMYRAQFREFGAFRTLLVNHTVDVGSDQAGIRWAELRDAGEGWSLFQTGTQAPDTDHRWMGSLAMDRTGTVALGYSRSTSAMFPAITYATRVPGDPAGVLSGGEVDLQAGAGAQITSSNRWGDYSTMSVDPVDECTFWYTQQYYANTAPYDFKTRIGAFKQASCGPCEAPVGVEVDSETINGPDTRQSCGDLSSEDTEIASGTVTFEAKGTISLENGFEVLTGATFVAVSNPFLVVDLP